MTFHYPSGIPCNHRETQSPRKQVKKKRPVKSDNRGMDFEEATNQSNQYYLLNKQAVVHKEPTPVQIVKIDYPKRSTTVIKEAYFRQASTTDYNGVYQGRYIDSGTRETKGITSFPFKNFHQHQIDHMEQCIVQQGICFVLLWFSSLERCFLSSGGNLITHWKNQTVTGKEFMPLALIEKEGIELSLGVAP